MPFDRIQTIQLLVLLLVVPLQYFITKHWSANEGQRDYALKSIYSAMTKFRNDYLSIQSWILWLAQNVSKLKKRRHFAKHGANDESTLSKHSSLTGESPAIEVLQYREQLSKKENDYFARSLETKTFRPPHIKYRVGQVVKHVRWGYRGVIIGWDDIAKAPEEWFQANHPASKAHWRKQPNYSLLVDTRDRMTPQTTYVPEENIEVISHIKIIHPLLEEFFEAYDGAQYIPRPWLKTVYPFD